MYCATQWWTGMEHVFYICTQQGSRILCKPECYTGSETLLRITLQWKQSWKLKHFGRETAEWRERWTLPQCYWFSCAQRTSNNQIKLLAEEGTSMVSNGHLTIWSDCLSMTINILRDFGFIEYGISLITFCHFEISDSSNNRMIAVQIDAPGCYILLFAEIFCYDHGMKQPWKYTDM